MRPLLDTAVEAWAIDQIVAFGWYDGPTDGLCRLSTPAVECWFTLLDAGEELRVYVASEVPAGTTARALEVLRFLEPEPPRMWVPPWSPDGSPEWRAARLHLEALERSITPPSVVLWGADLLTGLEGVEAAPERLEEIDWMTRLGSG